MSAGAGAGPARRGSSDVVRTVEDIVWARARTRTSQLWPTVVRLARLGEAVADPSTGAVGVEVGDGSRTSSAMEAM